MFKAAETAHKIAVLNLNLFKQIVKNAKKKLFSCSVS
jgi:hypothetical protein